ncbi:tetratricopeptide repeat protein [Peterkaempfera sp. SMS 1(5)a]|uniref:tetratricopeptide repeat protein n=1 Tax=Peterkaempfera podocarpi TaxID=3232308 RepID=UPI00366B80CF
MADTFQPGRRRLDLDLVLAIVRALGADGQQVNSWRQAYVRAYTETKAGGPVGVFRQLPADLPTFTGRADHMQRLVDTVDGRGTHASTTVVISAIEGMAGVGKTQLAIHAAHQLVRAGRFADVQLYVDLRGFDPDQPPADPSAVLGSFLRQLEVPVQQIPPLLAERSAMFRAVLNGRQALLLLDNAAHEKQVRDLIPASPDCLVLLTSRRTLAGLDGATTHLLDVFDADESIELLARIVGHERVWAEPMAAAEIVAACGHLPLAVTLAASRLRSRPAWTLADLAARLRDDDLGTVRIGGRSVDTVFDLSYRGLPEDLRRLFRLLGLFPGHDFTAAAAAALAGIATGQAQSILEQLLDEHLVQQKIAGRYELHDLARSYAAQRAREEDGPAARETALGRLLTWYLHAAVAASARLAPNRFELALPPPPPEPRVPTFADHAEALTWCEAERANLAAATEAADGTELAWMLARASVPYYNLRKIWDDWIATHRIGLAAAQARDDRLGQAWMHHGLARAQSDRRDPSAPDHFRAALDLFGDDHPHEAVSTLGNLAALHGRQGEYEQSLTYSQQALQLAREVGDRYSEAMLVGNIGAACTKLKRFDEAVDYLRTALAQHEADGNVYSQAFVLHNLGAAHQDAGRSDESADCYQQALELRRRIGDRHGEATTLALMAELAQSRSRPDQASRLWRTALAIFEDLGDPAAGEVRARLDMDHAEPDSA